MLLGENGLLSVREAMELKALASRTEVVVLTFAANGGDQPSSVRTDSDQDPARVLISNQASELCELRSMLADLWKERPVEAEASKVKVSVLEEEVEVLRKENAEVTSALRESVEEVAALRHTLASQSVAHEKETRQLAVAYSQMEAAYDNEVFDATELLGRIQRVILTEGLIATDNEGGQLGLLRCRSESGCLVSKESIVVIYGRS
ncbi:MAG: uncharacterized protein KVP18_004899 [Porospora cf. gigantea A]|uniref:uncharacterized protein n=1 Tax=Porospora cf. gigantea A TaxID=2853593 RepID=UPI00355A9676|nr:MAG: hypothetical protein KVP18_004899 [Porospora cf. gigantea A]